MPGSGSYRWVVVAAATLGLGAAFGAASTISVLIGPFEAEYGWLRSETSFAFTLLSVGAAFGGLLAGRLADRMPIAPIAMAGAAVIALALILVGQQSSIRAIQIVYLTLGLFGFSCLYGPLLTAVTGWFDRGHGLALGIVASGGVLGQAAVPPLFQALVAGHGWRQASMLLGCGYLVAIFPAMALVRKSPASTVSGGGAPAIWPVPPTISLTLIGAAAFFCCALMAVPTVHLFALDYRNTARFWPRCRGADDDDPDAGGMGRPHLRRGTAALAILEAYLAPSLKGRAPRHRVAGRVAPSDDERQGQVPVPGCTASSPRS